MLCYDIKIITGFVSMIHYFFIVIISTLKFQELADMGKIVNCSNRYITYCSFPFFFNRWLVVVSTKKENHVEIRQIV
jgi:hypothetical protein